MGDNMLLSKHQRVRFTVLQHPLFKYEKAYIFLSLRFPVLSLNTFIIANTEENRIVNNIVVNAV